MRHLTLALCTALVVALTGVSVNAQRASAPAQVAQTPGAVIKSFYRWYIHSVSHGPDPFKGGRATLKKYVTLRLIQEVERSESDADYFLQTQDWADEWGDKVSVSQPEVKGATATAVVTFNAEGYPRVKVSLRQEGRVWKIDRVKEARIR